MALPDNCPDSEIKFRKELLDKLLDEMFNVDFRLSNGRIVKRKRGLLSGWRST